MKSGAAVIGFFVGGGCSFLVGCVFTPAWEFAFLIIPPFCAITGAFAGLLAARSWRGTGAALLLGALAATCMGWLARKNPDWVVRQSVIAVSAGVGLSVLVGYAARKRSEALGIPGR